MTGVIANLKLLHKLALPAFVCLVAAAVTGVTAKSWLDAVGEQIAAVVDRDAARLELALGVVNDLDLITVTSRDVRLATKEDEVEKQGALSGKLQDDIAHRFAAMTPLMESAENQRLVEEAVAAFRDFSEITNGTIQAKLDNLRTGAEVPLGGKGRVIREKVDETLGKLVAASKQSMSEAKEKAKAVSRKSAMALIFGAGSAQLLALALLAWIGIVQIARPLGRMTALMERLAQGDLDIVVTDAGNRDEVGALGRALAVFKENAVKARGLEQEQHAEHSRKEARAKAVDARISAFEGSAYAALDAVAAAAGDMRSSSAGMSASAAESGKGVAAALAASEQASANVRSVASATEELSTSIADIGAKVGHAADITGKAVRETEDTDAKVRGLSEAASRIGEVVQLITAIAGQTNLLALNATIEAARAGEAGKGFAVVASEVKNLANQTAKATEEISGQIAAIQQATGGVVAAIKTIGGTIAEVSEVSTAIAQAIEQQGAAVREISRSTHEAATSAAAVATNIAGVSGAADNTRKTAAQELAAADTLAAQANALRGEVDTFLVGIRAA